MQEIIHILKHSLLDILKIMPFLFLAFLIIELIEHKLNNKKIISKSGKFGPLIGSILGAFPQCGFSVMATNLYITRILSLGTLIAIYLSTSDEMLPILISEKVSLITIVEIVGIKIIIGMVCGFIIDFLYRNKNKNNSINYSICTEEHCHCEEENLLVSALKHTITTATFIFIITLILNIFMEYIGEEYIPKLLLKDSIISPLLTSLIGLIPNCASSIIITELYLSNAISFASLISGLLTGSGIALLVLFKNKHNKKENIKILALTYLCGALSGIIIELINLIV